MMLRVRPFPASQAASAVEEVAAAARTRQPAAREADPRRRCRRRGPLRFWVLGGGSMAAGGCSGSTQFSRIHPLRFLANWLAPDAL